MIAEVASLVGGDDDPDVRTRALIFLDRAVDHLNMNGIVMCQQRENTYVGGVDYINGASTLTLPSDWGWPEDRAQAYNSSNKFLSTLEWRPWEEFKGFINDLVSTSYSVPAYLSIKTMVNESLIYMWPFVDSTKVAKIIVPYYARIQTLSETTSFVVPKEIREALIMYGEFLMMRYRYKDKPAIWQSFKENADQAMRRAKASATRADIGWNPAFAPNESGLIGSSSSILSGATYIMI